MQLAVDFLCVCGLESKLSKFSYLKLCVACTEHKWFLCTGGLSARAAREKMYEHGSAMLAKSSSSSRLCRGEDSRVHSSADGSTDMKPKGKRSVLMLHCIMFGWVRHKQGGTCICSVTAGAAGPFDVTCDCTLHIHQYPQSGSSAVIW